MSIQAGDHIHANEVILTFGMSNTTLLFLKEAAKKRDFQVQHDCLLHRCNSSAAAWEPFSGKANVCSA